MARVLLKCYLIMLVCTATVTVCFYVVAAYTASRIDTVVENNWENPDFQAQKANTIMRNMTKTVSLLRECVGSALSCPDCTICRLQEFTDVMESGYNLISMAAFSSMLFVFVALLSTYYTSKAPP